MDLLSALIGIVLLLAAAWLVLVAIVWLHRPSREPTLYLVGAEASSGVRSAQGDLFGLGRGCR
jgi:high-affinity Fe2+/Pb2+ permease